jgi:ribonuclease Z
MSDKPFDFQLVNGLQGDPAVFLRLNRLGEAVLFDLGSLDALPHKDLLRVRHVFVSHTHVDHFIGFDRLLRVNIPHRRTLQLYGPTDFIEKVRCKLRSYTWNLLEDGQLCFKVLEIHRDGQIWMAELSNSDQFSGAKILSDLSAKLLVTLCDGAYVSAALMDHKGIDSVSFKIETASSLKIRVESLRALSLKPGAWLSELQDRFRNNQLSGNLTIDGKDFDAMTLADALIVEKKGRSLVYLTDLAFSAANIQGLKSTYDIVSDIIVECSFMETDRHRAVAKAHLTTRQSALIAATLGVQNFRVFHVSGIYGQGAEEVEAEAQTFFQDFNRVGFNLDQAIAAELLNIATLP